MGLPTSTHKSLTPEKKLPRQSNSVYASIWKGQSRLLSWIWIRAVLCEILAVEKVVSRNPGFTRRKAALRNLAMNFESIVQNTFNMEVASVYCLWIKFLRFVPFITVVDLSLCTSPSLLNIWVLSDPQICHCPAAWTALLISLERG